MHITQRSQVQSDSGREQTGGEMEALDSLSSFTHCPASGSSRTSDCPRPNSRGEKNFMIFSDATLASCTE